MSVGDKKPTQLGTSATLIYQPVGPRDSLIVINDGPDVAYIGQAGVTYQQGLPLWPGDRVSFNRVPQALYAVASPSNPAPHLSIFPGVS